MTTTTTIEVPCCPVCGDHAKAVDFDATLMSPTTTAQVGDKGLFVPFMSRCQDCGTTVCYSCLADGAGCERRAEIETEGRPPVGQLGLFT